ncbi:P-loop containing nucleoside triphosphate hydrolase protein, partial [Dioscorea alata]
MAGLFSNALEMIKELSTPHAVQYLEPIWSGVDEQLQKLQFSLLLIQPLVEDAEARQLKEKAVRCWLVWLKDAVYDAKDILDEAKTHELVIQRKAQLYGPPRSKVREFFSLNYKQFLFKLKLGKKLKNVNEKINDLIEKMDKFKLRPVVENNSKPLGNRPQTYSYLHESRVILGRDEDKEKLEQMLISDCFGEKVAVVSIVGMGGLGKTTLAQLVFADERVKNHFEQCIWVCVSDDFDVPKLAGEIVHTASGEKCDYTNMEVLQQRLRKELWQKRYLLVLDDVWNEDFQKWDALRNMFLDGGEGSRILVTTRNEKCSRVIGAQKPFILSGLSKESSWVLFEQKAFVDDAEKAPELVEIGKRIVMKCRGPPLAIQVIGCVMRCKSDENEWQAVLKNETWKSHHTENKILPELWLSYVDLSSHLKRCFAFCSIFRKGRPFWEHELIQFWMAHGLIPSGKGTDMEAEGRETFTALIRRSLLQNYFHEVNERVCLMHDLIHDLAHFVMENECFTSLKSSAAPEIPIKRRHLSLDADENYNQGDCSNIHTVLYCRRDLSVLSKLKLVRMLDLSEAKIEELPGSIEHLHHLRYLDLSFTNIRKLPESICMLVNLQTLILYGCFKLFEFPKSITYMNSLRHVFYNDHPEFEASIAGLSQLQNLKTVTGYTVEDDAENNIGQFVLKSSNPFGEFALYNLQKVKNADDARKANLGNKQLIHKLKLSWGKLTLKPPSGVKELTVSYYPGKQFPMWMGESQQFQYLYHIELFKCKACEQLPQLEILPCLEYLEISRMHGIKHIINNRGNAQQSFPALKFLNLEYMENLEGWCVEEVREANPSLFPCLLSMEIIECPKLTTMPTIPTLQELYMKNSFCETQISLMSTRRSQLSLTLVLQNLTSLTDLWVTLIEHLVSWPDEMQGWKSLNYLTISSCKNLTVALSQGGCGPSLLTRLHVSDCDALRKLPMCPKSLQDLVICNCPGIESLWPELAHFTSLSSLKVSNCPKLVSLSHGMQALTSLKNLSITSCPALKSFPRGLRQLLPTLKELTIKECPELE